MAARIDAQLAMLDGKERAMKVIASNLQGADRQPWFCSGCPHNTSYQSARGLARHGGHWLPFHDHLDGPQHRGLHPDGRRGRALGGQAPFTSDQHIFANLGDGTYFHSGLLAVRQSIAAGVNITYKILYNDAVAMTGGQQVGERPEGHSVVQIAQSMRAEGAQKITSSPTSRKNTKA
jgi:indolepyruvate ferredoxin oxidoreductase